MDNGAPRAMDRLLIVLAVALGSGIVVTLFLVSSGDQRGPLLPVIFLVLYIPGIAIGLVGNRLLRPTRLTFSTEGAILKFPSGRIRQLSWDTIASVAVEEFLQEKSATIHYLNGRLEDKAHIYGEAALELKRRFEEWQDTQGK